MTTETTASIETTEVPNEAPVEVTPTEVPNETPAEVPAEAPDYSYVPKKFLNSEGVPDWENMAKSYTNLEKKIGQRGAQAPEDIAEYEWSGTAPIDINEETATAFKSEAQKAGLSKEQYAFVMGKYEQIMTEAGFNPDASADVLKKEWGTEFNTNLKYARRAFEELAPSDVSITDPVLNHPTVVKLLARVGMELNEDSQVQVKGSATRGTPMSADEIKAIQADPNYWNDMDKQAIVTKWYEKNYR